MLTLDKIERDGGSLLDKQFACVQIRHNPLSGGYCGEVPPLPIPNREVKLTCADGTAMQCGRVGSRLLLLRASVFERFLRLFCLYARHELILMGASP